MTKRIEMGKIYVLKGFNSRKDTDPCPEMVESISLQGITEPIHVAKLKKDDDKFFIVGGERRFRAARKLRLTKVPVINEGVLSMQEALIKSLILNENREPLDDREKYDVFEKLLETGMEVEDSAQHVGISVRQAKELETVYRKASEPVKKAVKKSKKKGGITTRTAAEISKLPKDKQKDVLKSVEGKTQKEADEKIKKKKQTLGIPNKVKRKTAKDPTQKPNGRIVLRDDYPIADDFKDRCQIIEHEARVHVEWYPKNPIYQAYLDVINVMKGGASAMSLFKGE